MEKGGWGRRKGEGKEQKNKKRNTTKINAKMLSQIVLFLKLLFIILNTIEGQYLPENS